LSKRALLLFLFTILTTFLCTACTPSESNITQNDLVLNDKQEQNLEVALFSQNDFILKIDTLPYRGAVLFIEYYGEDAIADYQIRVDIEVAGDFRQRDTWGENDSDLIIAEIVDLMYLPGDQLDITLKIKDATGEKIRYNYPLVFENYYPWKDWMLAEGEWFSVSQYSPNFKYDFPNCPNNLGAHSSWDIGTTNNKAVKVYCGTVGIVYRIPPACIEGNLEIYNPFVGAIVQYGHTKPTNDLYIGKEVIPGEHIANVIPRDKHIHYSVIRPYRYVLKQSNDGAPYYMPIINNTGAFGDGRFIYHDSYNDPYYWHEPTTLGYWNEQTLPSGLKEEMLRMFQKDNPNVVLPAIKPLDAD
jgi:hypothetical protein